MTKNPIESINNICGYWTRVLGSLCVQNVSVVEGAPNLAARRSLQRFPSWLPLQKIENLNPSPHPALGLWSRISTLQASIQIISYASSKQKSHSYMSLPTSLL